MSKRNTQNTDYRLHIIQEPEIGFQSVICLHEYGRGSAIGGCRFIEYDSFDTAIEDVIRLSRTMCYKSIMSELPHDGGKGVIMRPKGNFNREQFLMKFGQLVESLDGKFITSIDSGTTPEDMITIGQSTRFVIGEPRSDMPIVSESTAIGVFNGIVAAVEEVFGRSNLEGLRFAVQGLGSVGYRVAKALHQKGGKLIVCDKDTELAKRCAKEFKAKLILTEAFVSADCDVLVPCALGKVFNNNNITTIRAKIIAGAANDQLAAPDVAEQLHVRNILYIPDYVINAGGLVHVSTMMRGKDYAAIQREVEKIHHRIIYLVDQSKIMDISVLKTADGIVQQRLTIAKCA